MKKILALILVALALCNASAAQELVRTSHPRLILDKKEFREVRRAVRKGENEPLLILHNSLMKNADNFLTYPPIVDTRDAGGRRIQNTSGPYIRIGALAYAYRFTSDKRYLDAAEKIMIDVCNFPTWNPDHFLDVAMIARGIAIGYDWLYHDLKPSTRALAVQKLREYALETAEGRNFYNTKSNWNAVCNCGLVTAAIATFESNPELSRKIINAAVASNPPSVLQCYWYDGNYSEGPSYWEYGTGFEVFMLTVMETCLGTDYGLGGTEGFQKTPQYILFCRGTSGKYFNYYDNYEGPFACPAMWYFADKFFNPSILYNELQLLRKGYAYNNIMLIRYTLHLDFSKLAPPSEKMFWGWGDNPVVLVRTGWEGDPQDRYLGVKGGQAKYSHGHMDAGSFVYDAYGMRWAMDLGHTPYALNEKLLAGLGGSIWKYDPESWRWRFSFYNNRHHNTLTVNGKNHYPKGFAELKEVIDSPERRGGTFDLTPVFDGDLERAVRTAVVRDGSYLEVVDSLVAPQEAPATVRWTLVTPAEAEITPDGILLSQGGKQMILSTSVVPCDGPAALAPARHSGLDSLRHSGLDPLRHSGLDPLRHSGLDPLRHSGLDPLRHSGLDPESPSPAPGTVTYKIWQPEIEPQLAPGDIDYKDIRVCGFELTLPAGASCTLVTTMK